MTDRSKIATCSYCGTRAVLSLRGTSRHELSCSSCAAPIHLMKPLKSNRSEKKSYSKPQKRDPRPERKDHRKRRRKDPMRALFAKVSDEIEDIFD